MKYLKQGFVWRKKVCQTNSPAEDIKFKIFQAT